MISDRSRGIQRLVLICQCLLVTGAFWGWFFLCNSLPIDRGLVSRYLVYNEFVVLGLLVGTSSSRLREVVHRASFEATGRHCLRQLRGTLFFLLLYLVAAHDSAISRIFFFSFIPLLYVLLFISNRFLPSLLGRLLFRREMLQKVLLVGPRGKALKVKQWLEQSEHLGLEILGLLTDEAGNGAVANGALPTLGRPEELEKFLTEPGIMEVIMVEFPRSDGLIHRVASVCEGQGVRLLVMADLDRIFGYPLAVYKDQGMFFLGLREEPLEDPVNRFFKRCLDVIVSLPVVVFILPPLIVIVWICQRLQSPGPLFFRQEREGFHNRPFKILKFRSMHVGDSNNVQLPSSKEDPRLYPVGSFLRKSSLDEMPQFWNVFRGDMSIVGPRPHMTSFNEEYRRVFFRAYVRSFVKPGITGLAQVRGFRGNAEAPEAVVHRMESDIEYLENWTFGLDCMLIARTATQMLFPPKTAI